MQSGPSWCDEFFNNPLSLSPSFRAARANIILPIRGGEERWRRRIQQREQQQ
jgi:hypothetical protein